jgi:V8-like Glu-specific endopeptidase
MKTLISNIVILLYSSLCIAQNCDSDLGDKRRIQVTSMQAPFSYVVQMQMYRGRTYSGTAFFIHPRVLLTAGHNLRKRPQFIFTRVKSLALHIGATDKKTNLYETTYDTQQNVNIYTLDSFNNEYSIYEDYGLVILPDETAFKKAGGKFILSVYNPTDLIGKTINITSYPSDKPFCTQWTDNTSNFFTYKNYMHYDFSTEHGASGAPIWFDDKDGVKKVFGIHTNGDGFDQYKCNTATLISQNIYNDIILFCLSKGIDVTK